MSVGFEEVLPATTQATTIWPAPFIATVGAYWLPAVVVLTRNSVPSVAPSFENCRAYTPHPLPSWFWLAQATTACPTAFTATVERPWSPTVVVFTRNSVPSFVPSAANRWPYTPSPSPSWLVLVQVTRTFPAPSIATA